MENFIVSARKYRPLTFNSVIGQNALIATLKNAIVSKHLAHAYLFCGPRGVGKTTCARIFAKTINCENLTPEHESCNQCESCVSFNEQRSYNIHELDAASNNGVDDIRSLIDQVRIPPQIGKYSVYIVDEVHMLSQGAFNAFLKTLEEPPAHAIFILATTEKHKIIPTILSRCQIYDFNRISISDTVKHLMMVAQKEGVEVDVNALSIIAQKSDGGMRDALSIFDQLVSFCGNYITYQGVIDNLNVLDYEYYFKLIDCFLNADISESLLIFNEILINGFDPHHFITGLSSHLRDVLVSKDTSTLQLLETSADISKRFEQLAQRCPVEFIIEALEISNDCDLNYRISKNKRLLIELTLIRLCQLVGEKKKLSNDQPPVIRKIIIEPQKQLNSTEKSEVQNPIIKVNPVPHKVTIVPKEPIQANIARPESISISAPLFTSSPSENYVNKVAVETVMLTNQFTDDELNTAWLNYTDTIPDQIRVIGFMRNAQPSRISAHELQVEVSNVMQEKEMNELKVDICNFLANELKNNSIRLSVKLSEVKSETKTLTQEETLKRMIEQNSSLERLRKNLKLEID